jgi:hypothetical protein
VYRYGAFGVQLWDVWCTDMGLLVCSYGRLWKIRCAVMGFLKRLKLKDFFIWCADMGLLVCSYGELALRPEKPRQFFIWCTDMGTRL